VEIKEFYAQSLNVSPPWRVVEVAILEDKRSVEVRVECSERVVWVDPDTGERAAIHGWRERRWRHLNTCEFETWVVAEVPRVKLSSGEVITAKVPWAERFGRFTCTMETFLIDALRNCPSVFRAASLAGISRDQAEGVMQRAVARGLTRREQADLELVGIDEKAFRKGHRYATVLTDLIKERVVDVIEGRSEESTCNLLQSLPGSSASTIQAVAMDMWPAYINAVEELLPDAAIVFDRFHIKKHLNEAVDLIRRQEHRQLSAEGDSVLTGTKYQWLRNHDDMRRKGALEFRDLLTQKLQTGEAWSIKELFDHFWSYTSRSCAMRFFYHWIDTANESGLKPLIKVAGTLLRHMAGIMNYISFPITNASSEGMNSQIQHLRFAARGLPKFANFRARILFHLGGLDMEPA
jgi:transposase